MLRFPNPDNNAWISRYNQLIEDVESGKLIFNFIPIDKTKFSDRESYRIANARAGKLTLHHIIPKKIDPSLEKCKENFIYVPFKEHMDLHYYLWKADKRYAPHLRFGAAFGRKYGLWDFPGGDSEYEQMKLDCIEYKKKKKSTI